MKKYRVKPSRKFSGSPVIPGDKSISHRGLLFGALASGTTEITHLLESGDVQSTGRCLGQMGIEIEKKNGKAVVHGKGAMGLQAPRDALDCGNSGTTIRLLMGVLSGKDFSARMTGDSSLVKRPMKRVAEPLRQMGARFELTGDDYAPLTVIGGPLHSIDYDLKVASAQIKSAILLAALSANGTTTIRGQIQSRDHSERLLKYFGVDIDVTPERIQLKGGQALQGRNLRVPGDPSTAAFWIAAASLIENSKLELENISLNPTRTGFARALERMGAQIKTHVTVPSPEPVGNLEVTTAHLKGTLITDKEVPSLIDELPLIAVLATQAKGTTEVRGAEELRVKETDRIEAVAANLRAMGAAIETREDGFVIEGPQQLKGAVVNSYHDHRIAMAFAIAGLVAQGETEIHGADCVGISYPAFYATLEELTR